MCFGLIMPLKRLLLPSCPENAPRVGVFGISCREPAAKITNLSDAFNVVDSQPQQLSHYISLDTSSTINASSLSSPLPFGGCAFTFGPPSYVGKTSSDGSCGKIFGQFLLERNHADRPRHHSGHSTRYRIIEVDKCVRHRNRDSEQLHHSFVQSL